MNSPESDPLLWKVAGAVAGTIISLAYIRPLNIRDAISRAVVSMTSGVVFGFFVLEYFELSPTIEHIIASSALAALLAWFIIGMAIRLIKSYDKPPKAK